MHILVSNDDGILAPGVLALARAMLQFGEVSIVAPEENQSANGHRKTLTKPLRVTPVPLDERIKAYSTDGSPADCVALALLGYIPPVDMVVSGINRGANLGQDVTYSGTIAATFEAAIYGKPAVAFSLDSREMHADYSASAEVAQKVVGKVVQNGFLPPMTILSVNIPYLPTPQMKGFQVARQGTRMFHDRLDERHDPFDRAYYWIAGGEPGGDIHEAGTDIKAIHDGYVSLTPIQLDLTAYSLLSTVQAWGW
jgi:5'-nucleotidase